MSNKENNELQQQQIMFSEVDDFVSDKLATDEKQQNPSSIEMNTEQIIFDNTDYLPGNIEDSYHEVRSSAFNSEQKLPKGNLENRTVRRVIWPSITLIFLMLVAIELVEFFILGFESSPIITTFYAILFSLIMLVASNALWHELRGLRQFKKRQKTKEEALSFLTNADLSSVESIQSTKEFCHKLSKSLPCDLVFNSETEQQAWDKALAEEHNSQELIQLYSRVVLSKVDEKALNEVAKFSTESVVLVALSPVAIIDMLIMLSRNLRMINKIAGLYGLKLGYWSRIKLIKQVFVNMAYAGASELVADFGSEMLGAELMGKLSTRFAQGLGAGMLTARLGAKTMEVCRPIPFEEKPKLTHVRQKIAQQVKSLISTKSHSS